MARKSEPNHYNQTQLRHSETDIENPRSRRTVVVSAAYQDDRAWVQGAGRCRELDLFEIDHVGVGEMVAPYEVVRTHQSGAFFMACFGGQGQVLVDGRWRTLAVGQACLQPAGLRNSFRIGRGRRWDFCWVRFAAIRGLIAEQKADGLSRRQHQWVELIYDYVRGFAGGFRGDARIEGLWDKVQSRLGHPWDSQALARESGLSFEHLRRLCLKEIGRTPMNHLTHLRIQQAVRLISETDVKLAAIAQQVGFANGNSFSSAFKKSTGFAPSHFRVGSGGTD